MRYPFERYAAYLAFTDPVKAKDRLARADCRFLGNTGYEDFLASIEPIPKYKKGDLSDTAVAWCKEFGVYGMVVSDTESYRSILRVFKQQNLRQVLEQLLMLNLPDKEVAELFEEGTSVSLTDDAVARYQHYFWDTKAMSRLDWHDFMFARAGLKEISIYPNARDLWAALHIKPQLVLCKMQYPRYANIDKNLALNDLFNTAFMKSKEEAAIGSTHNFSKAAQVAIQAFEASQTSSSDVDEIVQRIQRAVKLVKNRTELTQIEALTGGHHSDTKLVVLLPERGKDGPKPG